MSQNSNNQCPYPTDGLYPSLDSLQRVQNQPYIYTPAAPAAPQDNSTSKFASKNTPPPIKPRTKAPQANIAQVEAGTGPEITPAQPHEYLMRNEIAATLTHADSPVTGIQENPSAPSEMELIADDAYWNKAMSENDQIENDRKLAESLAAGDTQEYVANGAAGMVIGNPISNNLLKLANSKSLHIQHSKPGHGKMSFEILADAEKYKILSGVEDSNMINGFSLKVLTLGIVNTKFSLSFNSDGKKVFEILRPIGSSNYIEIYLNSIGAEIGNDKKFNQDKKLIGYVRPTSFNINKIQFAVCNENKVEIGRFSTGVLRGLLSDKFEYVSTTRRKKCKLHRHGLIDFTESGRKDDVNVKLLYLAAAIMIKFNA